MTWTGTILHLILPNSFVHPIFSAHYICETIAEEYKKLNTERLLILPLTAILEEKNKFQKCFLPTS
jgi:hypothetical protein